MFKFSLILFLQLMFSLVVFAQQTDRDINEENISFYTEKYDACSSIEEMEALRVETTKLSLLNDIAYAKAIIRRGEGKKALIILADLSSQALSSSNYVKGEYYGAMGSLSYSSENPEEAIKYYKKSVFYLRKTANKGDLQSKYTSLGMTYTALKKYDDANYFYKKAIGLKAHGSIKNNLYLELNMALTKSSMGILAEAKAHFMEALILFKNAPDKYAEIRTIGNLGDIYVKQDSLKIAEEYYLKGLKMAQENGFELGRVRFHNSLATLYKNWNNLALAYKHQVAYDSLRNELDLSNIAKETAELEKQYELSITKIELKTQKERTLIITAFSILLFCLVWFLFYQWKVLKRKNSVLIRNAAKLNLAPKEEKLLKSEQLKIIESLEKLIITDQYYQNENITLDRVAKKLNTNRTYLSEAVNESYSIGFSKWLNQIRIKESIKLLSHPENDKYSIEGISKMVGFSSISAFNLNFKSITGLAPSYYRKNRLNPSKST